MLGISTLCDAVTLHIEPTICGTYVAFVHALCISASDEAETNIKCGMKFEYHRLNWCGTIQKYSVLISFIIVRIEELLKLNVEKLVHYHTVHLLWILWLFAQLYLILTIRRWGRAYHTSILGVSAVFSVIDESTVDQIALNSSTVHIIYQDRNTFLAGFSNGVGHCSCSKYKQV